MLIGLLTSGRMELKSVLEMSLLFMMTMKNVVSGGWGWLKKFSEVEMARSMELL